MKIEKMCWYKIIINGPEHIVRVDDSIMKYCVVDYYDGRLWFTGSCSGCKKFIAENLASYRDNNGKEVYMGRWVR